MSLVARDAAPISDLMLLLATAFGKKGQQFNSRMFNRYEQTLFVLEAKQKIPQATAQLFLQLMQQQKIPSWAMRILEPELDLIEAAAI